VGRLLLTALVAALLCVPAGTASAARSDVPARQWVAGVCGHMVSWEKALERRSRTFTGSLGGKDLTQLKGAFVSFLDDAISLSDTMLGQIDAAGTPAVPKGAAIRTALHGGLLRLRTIFIRARADAAALPATSAKRLGTGMETIGNRIQRQAGSLGKTFDLLDKRYPSKPLDQAFESAPACHSLN
jgi:hypothetical protein